MKKSCILILLLTFFILLLAETEYPDFKRHIEKTNLSLMNKGDLYNEFKQADTGVTRNMECYDVQYYFIDVTIDFEVNYITAYVIMNCNILEDNVTQIDLNFYNTLNVDGITLGETNLNFIHENDLITADLPEDYQSGEELEIRIDYSGYPVNRLNDGMKFRTHAGTPIVFTMVSPMGARKWWPCKDTPGDKPDSLDIRLTYPDLYISASNGVLVETITNGDGTKTDLWHESYPVATYLTSFAITNYEIYTQTYQYQDQEMDIVHHVYPEQYDVSVDLYQPTPAMIDFYSTIYGPYPFLTEKYGHATCTDLGALAMEHQTCTSFDAGYITDPESEYTVAHELAHQWTGDFLTIGNWEHVWLKEGFARYSEALWAENLFGYEALLDYMSALDNGSQLDPPLQRDPEGSGNDIFNIVIYSKGAWTQHMLRGVLGDEDYFSALDLLMSDPELMYGNFLTEDLEYAAEEAGEIEMDWFFDQWFYQEGRPSYYYTLYTSDPDSNPRLTIQSLPFQENYFAMFIPYQYGSEVGRFFAEGGINHLLLDVNGNSTEIEMDPDNWVLDYGYTEKLPVMEDIVTRDGNIGLAWEEFFDPDIDGFNLYRAVAGGEFVKLNETPLTENFYFDEDLELGITYQYKIKAVYNNVYESGFSNLVEVEPVDYTMDQGILLVDNSGDFNSPFPTDEEVDSFYYYLLDGLEFTDWDVADSGFPPLDMLAQYSLIIWHSDDILFNPLIDNFFPLKNYLTAGGKLFLSNCRSLEQVEPYDMENFLAVSSTEMNNEDDFSGAWGLEDYPDIAIDPAKIPMPTWDNAFANIYSFVPAVSGTVIYEFDSADDDPGWENQPCAVKHSGQFQVINLGFPLYYMLEEPAYMLMQRALHDLGEITFVDDDAVLPAPEIRITNYPNPFNPTTTISFHLTTEITESTELTIHNIKGQMVKKLTNRLSHQPTNQYSVTWNGTDDNNNPVSSGIYFAKLNWNGEIVQKKMVLMK